MHNTALDAVHATLNGRRLVFAAYHGSRLYGTATAQSDMDVRVVFMPTLEEILTGRVDFSLDNNPEKKQLGLGDVDVSAFSFARYLRLLGKFDVNAVEMLFASTPGTPAVIVSDESVMGAVRAQADRLIAMGGSSPIGHARAIVGAMAPDQDDYVTAFETGMAAIHNARAASGSDTTRLCACPGLLDALRALPGAKWQAHGHGAASIITEDDIPPDVLAAGRWPNHTLFVTVADRKIPTTMTLGEAKAVLEKPLRRMRGEQATRRARMEGVAINTKDLYHAIRILAQFVEIQATGRLTFPRPNADMLMAIRTGALTGSALQDVVDAGFSAALEAKEKPMPFGETPDADIQTAMIVAHHRAEILATAGPACSPAQFASSA